MQTRGFILNINSDQPEALGAFYGETVGLARAEGMGPHAFILGDTTHLIVDGHSDVHGKAKEAPRMLINFFVEDLAAEQSRLEGLGVPFIRKAGREEWGGVISTFLDPDGNYLQIVEFNAE